MSVKNLQGCADKRCRKWLIRYRVKRLDGTYSNRSKTFHGTKSEALEQEALLKARKELPLSPRGRLTDVAAKWAERRVSEGIVTDATAEGNVRRIRRLAREIGDVELTRITSERLSRAYAGMDASTEYIHNINATLRTMMRDAGLGTAVCDGARLPRNVRRERKVVGADGLRRISAIANDGSPSSYVVQLCAQTGMRRGEACALTLDDVDMEQGVMHVRASIDCHGHRKEPKTPSSVRDLPMTDGARNTIRSALAAFGGRILFPGDDGGYLDPHSVTRWWSRNRERLGYPDMTVHDLRHSYLSELARRGIPPKTLQAIAGHASFATTMDIYAHANLDDKRDAVSSVDW